MAESLERIKSASERLKYIREKLIKLSRSDIYKKYGLSVDTLAAWENGKTQLTEKAIQRCIKIYGAEDLIITKEWILNGEGLAPNFTFDLARYFKSVANDSSSEPVDDHILLVKELDFFRSLTLNSITILISSDDMLPLYAVGDYVGGRFLYGNDIQSCISKDCIVRLEDDAVYVRRLSKGKIENRYNLVCLNPVWNGNPEPVIFNAKLKCVAPIIWHRRPLPM
jgi:transcriptional regulator with XRE-family HTH domain